MATVPEQLEQLTKDKTKLSEVLSSKGVVASPSETFTTLVPKVAELSGIALTQQTTATENDLAPGVIGYTNNGKVTGKASNNNALIADFITNSKSIIYKLPDVIHYNNADSTVALSFSECTNLIELPDVVYQAPEKVTSISNIFNGCSSLKQIKIPDSIAHNKFITCFSAFNGCKNIEHVPVLDLTETTGVLSMFYGCNKLKQVDFIEGSGLKLTNASYMFYMCQALEHINNLDLSNATDISNCFYACSKLQALPPLNSDILIRCAYAFNQVVFNGPVPYTDFPNATDTQGLYINCTAESVPYINAPKATSLSSLFSSVKIKNIGHINAPLATSVNSMFNTSHPDYGLESIGLVDCTSVNSGADSMFQIYNMSEAAQITAYQSLTTLAGFHDLGKAYPSTAGTHHFNYTLNLKNLRHLTIESIINVFNELYDLTSINVNRQYVYLNDIYEGQLTDEQIAIATNKGWDIQYIHVDRLV